jgi:hypothetical protein
MFFLNVICFNYIKIKNHKKWESEKTKNKIRKGSFVKLYSVVG